MCSNFQNNVLIQFIMYIGIVFMAITWNILEMIKVEVGNERDWFLSAKQLSYNRLYQYYY